MRPITDIVVHCSDSSFGDAELFNEWHRERGFSMVGYHAVVLNGRRRSSGYRTPALDGHVEACRPHFMKGAHVKGYNGRSLGICWVGSADCKISGQQKKALIATIMEWMEWYGVAVERVRGHNEFPGVTKACPCLDMDSLRSDLEREGGG